MTNTPDHLQPTPKLIPGEHKRPPGQDPTREATQFPSRGSTPSRVDKDTSGAQFIPTAAAFKPPTRDVPTPATAEVQKPSRTSVFASVTPSLLGEATHEIKPGDTPAVSHNRGTDDNLMGDRHEVSHTSPPSQAPTTIYPKPEADGPTSEPQILLHDFDFSSLTVNTDSKELTAIADTLESTVYSSTANRLTRRLERILTPEEADSVKWDTQEKRRNGLLPGSEQFNATFDSIVEQIHERTTFFTPYQETGALDWIRAGMPEKFDFPDGVTLYESYKAPRGVLSAMVGGVYYYTKRWEVFKGTPPTKFTFITDLLRGKPCGVVDVVQHESAHALLYPKDIIRRHAIRFNNFSVALNEVFARRAEARLSIDYAFRENVVNNILHAKNEDGKPLYKVKGAQVKYAARAIDELFALYAMHPAIGMRNILQKTAEILDRCRRKRNKWNKVTNQYPVVQEEINKRKEELGIVTEDDLTNLVKKYITVRRIQRLGAQYIAQQELMKLPNETNS